MSEITINPNICFGKPVIRNTRYSVELILGLMSSGMSTQEILADYEDLTAEDLLACLRYATKISQVKRSVSLSV